MPNYTAAEIRDKYGYASSEGVKQRFMAHGAKFNIKGMRKSNGWIFVGSADDFDALFQKSKGKKLKRKNLSDGELPKDITEKTRGKDGSGS